MKTSPIQKHNREVARQINEEALKDPNSPYAGKFLGIIRGHVVVVADTLGELGRSLERMSADREETFCIEAGRDYTRVHQIWIA